MTGRSEVPRTARRRAPELDSYPAWPMVPNVTFRGLLPTEEILDEVKRRTAGLSPWLRLAEVVVERRARGHHTALLLPAGAGSAIAEGHGPDALSALLEAYAQLGS